MILVTILHFYHELTNTLFKSSAFNALAPAAEFKGTKRLVSGLYILDSLLRLSIMWSKTKSTALS